MTIERGTTQEITITIKGWDLTECDIYATFKQGAKSLTKKNDGQYNLRKQRHENSSDAESRRNNVL